jgi:hypothetical protein
MIASSNKYLIVFSTSAASIPVMLETWTGIWAKVWAFPRSIAVCAISLCWAVIRQVFGRCLSTLVPHIQRNARKLLAPRPAEAAFPIPSNSWLLIQNAFQPQFSIDTRQDSRRKSCTITCCRGMNKEYHAQDNELPAQSQTGRGFVFLRLGDLLLQLFVVAVRPETENAMFESCLARHVRLEPTVPRLRARPPNY